MPTIYKPPKKVRRINNNKKDKQKYVYNTLRWVNLRIEKLKNNPLCEVCKSKNKITLATQVHHIIFLSTGSTREELETIGFDYENLKSVCKECHEEIHLL